MQFDRKRSHLQPTPAEIEFTYDDLGRVTFANATGTDNDVTTTYDDFGNVETLTRNGKMITYDWDALGRLKSEATTISGQSLTVSYLYDTAGRRIRMTYPDEFYITYKYWGAGGLKYIKENDTNIIASYEYDAYSRGKKLTFGNDVYRKLDFDLANRVFDLDMTVPSDSGYDQAIDYGFNAASQITSKVVQNELYLPTDYGSSSDYSVNGLNQITDETSGGSTLNISYDKNGNLTYDGVTTFGYDLFNRLTSTSGGTSFDYDATGRLYSITSSSPNTYFLYDGQALIGEYTVDGTGNVSLQHRYIHGLDVDTPIVWYEGSAVSNSTRQYLVRDELGSVVLVTDNLGDAVHHNVYDEFGVPGTPGTSNVGRFQYTGQTWLAEAGLYYYKARVYNPYLGRFHQTDPIGYGDGLNMYAYARNSPTSAKDPLGTQTIRYDITTKYRDRNYLLGLTSEQEYKAAYKADAYTATVVGLGLASGGTAIYGSTTIGVGMLAGYGFGISDQISSGEASSYALIKNTTLGGVAAYGSTYGLTLRTNMLGAFGTATTSNLLFGLGESAVGVSEDNFSSVMSKSAWSGAFSSVGAGTGGVFTTGLKRASWSGPRNTITEFGLGFGAGGGEVVGGTSDRIARNLLDWLKGADASCAQDVTSDKCE